MDKKKAAEVCLEAAERGSEEARAVIKLMYDICKLSLPENTLAKWLEDVLSTSLDPMVRTLAIESLRTIEGLCVEDVVYRSRASQLKKSTVYQWALSEAIYEEEELGTSFEKFLSLSDGNDPGSLSDQEGTTLLAYYTLMGDEAMCRKLVDHYPVVLEPRFLILAIMSFNMDLVKMYLYDYNLEVPDETERDVLLHLFTEISDLDTDQAESARAIRQLMNSGPTGSISFDSIPELQGVAPQIDALRQFGVTTLFPIEPAILRNNLPAIEALSSGEVEVDFNLAFRLHRSDVLELLQERRLLHANRKCLVSLARAPASLLQLIHGKKWKDNCLKCAKVILKLGLSPFESFDDSTPVEGTAVWMAATCGNVPLLELFLKQDLPETTRFRQIFEKSVLGSVINNKFGTFRFLLRYQPRYCFEDKETLGAIISAATESRNPPAFIAEMVEQGIADTKTVYEVKYEAGRLNRGTLLCWAARSSRPEAAEVVSYLIRKGADPNWFDGILPPVAYSLFNPPVLAALIEGGAQIINTTWTLSTILHECAFVEHEPWLHALETIVRTVAECKKELDIDSRHPVCGSTPLHYAVMAGNRRAVEILLDAGANVLANNGAGVSPIQTAYMIAVEGNVDANLRSELSQRGLLGQRDCHFPLLAPMVFKSYAERKYIIELLHGRCRDAARLEAVCAEAKAQIESVNLSPVEARAGIAGILAASVVWTADLLAGKRDMRTPGLDGHTSLHIFALVGNVQAVNWFVSEKWNLDLQADDGNTCLHIACEAGHLEIVKILLEANADIMAQNKSGCTPLHAASTNGHPQLARMLLTQGAAVEERDLYGRTALNAASRNGHHGVVRVLLDAKACVNATSKRGWTALHAAARNGHEMVVKVLVDEKADVDVQTKDGWTALQLSAWHGHASVLKELIVLLDLFPSSGDDLVNVLEHLATAYPTDSLLRRAVGNECIRRRMISEAKLNFNASIEILLKKGEGERLENLEIEGVFCNGCRNQIIGRHYKCLECHWNMDFCGSCLRGRAHKHNNEKLIAIPTRPFIPRSCG
jgi:ankyrin repeat protein